MKAEFIALLQNHTWDLEPADASKNIIDCNWVFSIKYKPDESIDNFKVRLVSKGFK